MSSTTAADALSLRGRAAVITGASRGIGLECGKALHAAGARILLVARSVERAHDELVRAEGEGSGAPVSAHRCDLGDATSVARTLAAIRKELGRAPDILVNNAGRFVLAPVEHTDLEEFERTIRVNLIAQFAFVREFLADMRARGSGHVVTIGSLADHLGLAENAAYAASKHGARGLHEVLREELRGSGVRATLVSPAHVNTTLWDDVNRDTRPEIPPRARMLSATAVADAVRFAVTRAPEVNVDELRLSRT